MSTVGTARRVPTIPLVLAVLMFAGLALLVESQLRLPLRMPGHRAFPGAMALVLLAAASSRTVIVGFAAAVGTVIALVSHQPVLVVVWIVPALLLALAQPRSAIARVGVAITAGLAFGLLRYLTLRGGLHHTPDAVRLTGHLVFGALGSVGVAHDLYWRRRVR